MFTYPTCIRSHINQDVLERKKYLGKVHCMIAEMCTGVHNLTVCYIP